MSGPIFPWLYDAVMRTAERACLARWRRSIARPASGRIIEIGAGTGLNFRHYRGGVTVIATDPDLGMLVRARARARSSTANIVLVAADAEALPFRARTFDTAVAGLALCTIPHPTSALTELRRVLHPGALLRILEHVRVARPIVGRLQDWLTPVWQRIAGGCRLNRTTVETVAANGFVIDHVRPHAGGLVVETIARPSPEREYGLTRSIRGASGDPGLSIIPPTMGAAMRFITLAPMPVPQRSQRGSRPARSPR